VKKIIIVGIAVFLTACGATKQVATPPPQPMQNADLVLEKTAYPMSRNETVNAAMECESGGMRAVIVTAKRRVGTAVSDIVIDVYCAPRYKLTLY
jgi:hypothetical protein